MASPRLLLIFTFATGLVIGAVVLLALESWWLLAVAMLIHFAATALVVVPILQRAGQADKPDPVTEARLEEESIDDWKRDEAEPQDDAEREFAIPERRRGHG